MSTNTTNFISSFNLQFNEPIAAFYALKNQNPLNKHNPKWTKKIYNSITSAAKSSNLSFSNFNSQQFAKNISSGCSSKFVLDHIAEVLRLIILSKPVKDRMMLNLFMDAFAPVLNINLPNTPYKSLFDLRNGLKSGNLTNSVQFLQGMAISFNQVNSISNYANNYELILPVDIVNKVYIEQGEGIFKHSCQIGTNFPIAVPQNSKNKIHLDLTLINSDVNYLYQESALQKLTNCMASAEPVILKIGRNIFKDCVISNLKPVIDENVHKTGLHVDLIHYNNSNTNSYV